MSGEWRADPTGRHEHRYWDGERWTDQVSDAGAPSTDPYDMPTPEPPSSKKSKVPWIVGVVVLLCCSGAVVGLLTGSDDDEGESGRATTTTERTTTTEADAAATTEATTTTEVVLTADDVRMYVFPIVFDATRENLIAVLGRDRVIESVDSYTYDEATGTVLLSVTPRFDFDPGVRDNAWMIARAFGVFYEDQWVNRDPEWAPNLRVEVSNAAYECDGATMRDLAAARLTRGEWENRCRRS
jgi:hypothetical protein